MQPIAPRMFSLTFSHSDIVQVPLKWLRPGCLIVMVVGRSRLYKIEHFVSCVSVL
jgi:hypothetical protein